MTQKGDTYQLKGSTLKELRHLFEEMGEPGYRAEQLFRWMYQKRVTSFDQVTTFSKDLRSSLAERFSLNRAYPIKRTGESQDETVKFLMQLEDGRRVEAVYIPEDDRVTVCLSSQVGCALDCDFCATGKMGFYRHLDAGEIFEQFRILQDFSQRDISNIVFMGMGEPMNNYDEVMKAAAIFNHEMGPHIGRQKITISTVGVVTKILQFAREKRPYQLAISLNGTTNQARSALMPINKRWSLEELMEAARFYVKETGDRITFEYVLIKDWTDRPEDARRLRSMLSSLNCKLNVIPFNDTNTPYKRPPDKRIQAFLNELHPTPFPLTVRWSRGHDKNAACGQLQTETEDTSQPEPVQV